MPNGINDAQNNSSRNLQNAQNYMMNRNQNLPQQMLPNGSATGQNNAPVPGENNISNQDLEQMYPQLYTQIKPQIDEIAKQLQQQEVSEDMIQSIVDEIMQRSGISDYEDYISDNMESIATIARFNPYYYPNRRRRRYRRYYGPYGPYGPMTPEAWIRLLLLQQLGQYLY